MLCVTNKTEKIISILCLSDDLPGDQDALQDVNQSIEFIVMRRCPNKTFSFQHKGQSHFLSPFHTSDASYQHEKKIPSLTGCCSSLVIHTYKTEVTQHNIRVRNNLASQSHLSDDSIIVWSNMFHNAAHA